jgi:hypothetical protein
MQAAMLGKWADIRDFLAPTAAASSASSASAAAPLEQLAPAEVIESSSALLSLQGGPRRALGIWDSGDSRDLHRPVGYHLGTRRRRVLLQFLKF